MEVPKKVLYIITKSNWGGAQRYVFDHATAAKAAGFDVVVAYGGEGLLSKKLKEAGISTLQIPALARDIGFADFDAYTSISAIIGKIKPDIVHLNSSKAGGLGALAGRMHGVPKILFTSHGWAFREQRPVAVKAALWLASWLTALLSHKVIAVSDSELEAAKHMPFIGRKTVRIYNGINLAMPFGDGAVIRKAFPPNARITGTVGELTKNKNQISLVEKARNDSNMYVAIVGEGELKETLEQKIKEYGLENRVKLFGFLPAADVLKGFDVFVLPSIKEGLAYVILEARAAKLPIEADRVGGVGEALDKPLEEFALEKTLTQTFALY